MLASQPMKPRISAWAKHVSAARQRTQPHKWSAILSHPTTPETASSATAANSEHTSIISSTSPSASLQSSHVSSGSLATTKETSTTQASVAAPASAGGSMPSPVPTSEVVNVQARLGTAFTWLSIASRARTAPAVPAQRLHHPSTAVVRPAGLALPGSAPAALPSPAPPPISMQLLLDGIEHIIMMAVVKVARQLSEKSGIHMPAKSFEPILARTRAPWLHTSVRKEHRIDGGGMGGIYMALDVHSRRLEYDPAIIKVVEIPYHDALECDARSSIGELMIITLQDLGLFNSGAAPVAWDLIPNQKEGCVTLYLLASRWATSFQDYLDKYVHNTPGDQAGEERKRSVHVPSILRAAAKVTDQLSQLFRMGFVHADLKWQNVLVRIHPTKKTITDVTVADFGALTCLGKEVAVSVNLGTFMAHRSSAGTALASVAADMYNLGRMVMTALLGTWLMAGCYGPLVHALADLDLMPSVLPTITLAAVHQAAEQQPGAYEGCTWWQVKPEGLQAGGLMLSAEMGMGMTGDGGSLASSRLGALFSPGAQRPPVAQALHNLLPLCYRLMTLSGPECDQVSSTLRLQARSIEGAALTRRDTLLSVPPSLFPGSEEEYTELMAGHMLEHSELQELSEELMQQMIVDKHVQEQQLMVQVQEEVEEESDDDEGEKEDSDEGDYDDEEEEGEQGQSEGDGEQVQQAPPQQQYTSVHATQVPSMAPAPIPVPVTEPQQQHHHHYQPQNLSLAEKAALYTNAGWVVIENQFVYCSQDGDLLSLEDPVPADVALAAVL